MLARDLAAAAVDPAARIRSQWIIGSGRAGRPLGAWHSPARVAGSGPESERTGSGPARRQGRGVWRSAHPRPRRCWRGTTTPVPSAARVWIGIGVTDMRRSMNGLALLVQEGGSRNPHAGDLYVFRGCCADPIKCLWLGGCLSTSASLSVALGGPRVCTRDK
ncbi:IS66 family insertion sequence element accessory protein TnpB [Methylobacterium sp. E-005]|uniref:IS66 family insertion sequence element accessory protein TnpB n=1 Tax=Methylobacterium sp. E-005 TaxID=2836549 RepID=UPI00391BBB8A